MIRLTSDIEAEAWREIRTGRSIGRTDGMLEAANMLGVMADGLLASGDAHGGLLLTAAAIQVANMSGPECEGVAS